MLSLSRSLGGACASRLCGGDAAALSTSRLPSASLSSAASLRSLPRTRYRRLPLPSALRSATLRVPPTGERRSGGREEEGRGNGGWWGKRSKYGFLLSGSGLAFGTGHWYTLKHMLGLEELPEVSSNKDVADKIALSRKLRRAKKHDEAMHELHCGLDLLKGREASQGAAWAETHIYDEMAQIHLEKAELDKAANVWTIVLSRLLNVHGKLDQDPAFIQASLNLALVFAKRGQLIQAEMGYRHCLDKQEGVAAASVEALDRNEVILVPSRSEHYGPDYTDPQALLGSCLEHLAHFLLASPPPSNSPAETRVERVTEKGVVREVVLGPAEARVAEAERCIWRAAEVSSQIAGPTSAHAVVLLNSFAVKALAQGEFGLAAKVLTEVARKAVLAGESVAEHLPAYFCNLAEALFHSGRREEALDVGRRALLLANASPHAQIRRHCQDFVAELERDCKAGGVKASKSWEGWLG